LTPNQTVEQALRQPRRLDLGAPVARRHALPCLDSQNTRLSDSAAKSCSGRRSIAPRRARRRDRRRGARLQQELAHVTDAIVRLRFVMTDRVIIQRTPHARCIRSRPCGEASKPVNASPRRCPFSERGDRSVADAVAHGETLGNELDNIEDPRHARRLRRRGPRVGGAVASRAVHRHLAHCGAMFHRVEHRMSSDNAPWRMRSRALAQKLDAIRPRSRLAARPRAPVIDEVAAKMTETTTAACSRLSILTACFLPPTLVPASSR